MAVDERAWQTAALAHTYLGGVRGAIPLAQEQISIMLRLVQAACPSVKWFLDLGCGDGILGHAILDLYPEARGVLLDFSEPMLDAARNRLGNQGRVTFVLSDYGDQYWWKSLANDRKIRPWEGFDVIVSGYSIHHQVDARKQEIYAELYALLRAGGILLNLEHVASRSKWIEGVFADYFIDALSDYHVRTGSPKSRQEIDREYYSRPDKAANRLTLVETQCEWLRKIGFEHVDCYLKSFELALFGGIKPREQGLSTT